MIVRIYANAAQSSSPTLGEAHDFDFCIAADGGYRLAIEHGVKPELIIGDLDSLPHELIERAERENIEIQKHNKDKAHTDFELALMEAKKRGATELQVFGLLDERIDYMLDAILSLADCGLQNKVFGRDFELEVLNQHRRFSWVGLAAGTKLSIYALSPDCRLKSEGLKWELDWQMGGRSQSNESLNDSISLELSSGTAFALVEKKP